MEEITAASAIEPVFVPYRQQGEPPRKAGLIRVEVPLEGLSANQLQLIGHLCRAVDAMNTVFRRQIYAGTDKFLDFLGSIGEFLTGDSVSALEAYIQIIHLQNGPWSFIPRKNHILNIDEAIVRAAAERAGKEAEYEEFRPFLYELVPFPDKAEFYPAAITEDDLSKMGEEAQLVNSIILEEENGRYRTVLNEQYFREHCERAVRHLETARDFSEDPEFTLYLDAKIEELRTGSGEARRLADYHWIRHNSDVDVILSTALEVYLDGWQNVKGAACGAVLVKNHGMEQLMKQFVARVAAWESTAPWKWKREQIDTEKLPKLKFVDVFNWSGDYVSSPQTVLAQSLPNDEWVGKNIGTVNMLYRNTGEAVHQLRGSLLAEEFLPKKIMEQYGEQLYYGGQIHAILHEIGHTTGRQDPDHPGQPSSYLKEEYSPIEEARAELFGMWAAQASVQAGIITRDVADAGQYSMLLSMINSLKFEAAQAHNIARNVIFHYLRTAEVIRIEQEDGRKKLSLDLNTLHPHVERLLGRIGDIKAAGDREGAAALRDEYCFEDPLRPEIEERTASIPLGTGLIFPALYEREGKFIAEIDYPAFIRQGKFM